VDHCIAIKVRQAASATDKQDTVRLEDSLPVVTNFAFRIQDQYNTLVSTGEDQLPERTFVVSELLKLAVNLDYADENGRRQMFSLTRASHSLHRLILGDMLKEPNLPESLIPGCLDVLCKIANNERDFIRVVVEDVITDLRLGEGDEDGIEVRGRKCNADS
jgi:condensin complex subunit 3